MCFEKIVTKETFGSCGPTSVVLISVYQEQELTFLFNKVSVLEPTQLLARNIL
jgi:hypothetical protein